MYILLRRHKLVTHNIHGSTVSNYKHNFKTRVRFEAAMRSKQYMYPMECTEKGTRGGSRSPVYVSTPRPTSSSPYEIRVYSAQIKYVFNTYASNVSSEFYPSWLLEHARRSHETTLSSLQIQLQATFTGLFVWPENASHCAYRTMLLPLCAEFVLHISVLVATAQIILSYCS